MSASLLPMMVIVSIGSAGRSFHDEWHAFANRIWSWWPGELDDWFGHDDRTSVDKDHLRSAADRHCTYTCGEDNGTACGSILD